MISNNRCYIMQMCVLFVMHIILYIIHVYRNYYSADNTIFVLFFPYNLSQLLYRTLKAFLEIIKN